jgi:hypothetical protein
MEAALMSAFADFDPFASVDKTTGDVAVPNLNATYRQPLLNALGKTLGHDIAVRTVAFGRPVYDEATTKSLSDYGQKVLDGRNLDVDKTNAVKRKAITDIDAQVNPVARCLSIAEKNGKEPGLCMGSSVALTHSTN